MWEESLVRKLWLGSRSWELTPLLLCAGQCAVFDQVSCGRFTFADFQVNGVIDVLGQFLAASRLFKHKALEMKHQHRRQLLQGHPPTDLDLTGDGTQVHTGTWGTHCEDKTATQAQLGLAQEFIRAPNKWMENDLKAGGDILLEIGDLAKQLLHESSQFRAFSLNKKTNWDNLCFN